MLSRRRDNFASTCCSSWVVLSCSPFAERWWEATMCLIALGIALVFMFARPSRALVRLGAGISAILLVVVILLTQSRGAFIGLVAGMGPALIGLGLKRPRRLLLSAGILALVIGLVIPASVW